MDYSKTHYYKSTAPAAAKQTRSTAPVFEIDDVNISTDPGPVELPTPALPSENDPVNPGIGPEGLPTPSLPSTPADPDRPIYQPNYGGSVTTPGINNSNNTTFWSYVWLSPLFNNLNPAQIRFYNVNSMLEPVDVYINNQLVASDLEYSEYTDFLYIIPGYYNVTVYRRTNPGYPLLNVRVNFVRNSTCFVSIIGTVDTPGLQFIC